MGYIYCIINLINNKKYVGKTTQTIEKRFTEHCQDSKRKRCEKRPLYNAFNKYGIENFKIQQLEFVEDDNRLSEREIFWIKELNTYGSGGYNASQGGDGTIIYNHEEIIELVNLGYTQQQVSNKIGCSKDTVFKVLKAHGVKSRAGFAKLIAQFDLTGNYIQTFWGGNNVQKWLISKGITNNKRARAHINSCCRGDVPQAYGYKWTYLEEPK